MKEENKKCWSCIKYKCYYTKGIGYFDKEKIGRCLKYDKIVGNHDSCDQWGYGKGIRSGRKQFALNFLSEILSRLTVIEQIMTEETELEKLNNETD